MDMYITTSLQRPSCGFADEHFAAVAYVNPAYASSKWSKSNSNIDSCVPASSVPVRLIHATQIVASLTISWCLIKFSPRHPSR